jgi:hypothetical protein
VLEDDQRVCPRCGQPAGDYRFCESCRSHIDSLTRDPSGLGAHTGDQAYTAAQAPREALGFEQALTATSNGDSDRVGGAASAAAVHTEPDSRPAPAGDASAATFGKAELWTTDGRIGAPAQAPADVARLEQVLSMAPPDDRTTAKAAAPPVPAAEPAQDDVGDAADDTGDGALERAKRALELLEAALSTDHGERIATTNSAATVPNLERARNVVDEPIAGVSAAPLEQIELPARAEGHPSGVSDVAAHLLREAFWFEQASAFKANGDRAAIVPQAGQPAALEVDPEPSTPDSAVSIVQPDASAGDLHPCPRQDTSQPVVRLWMGRTSQSHWLAALCLLALVAVVVVLTGRAPRRFSGR